MAEIKPEEVGTDENEPLRKVGFSFGTIAAYIVAGGILAVFTVSMLKLIMWIWAL